MSQFDKLYTSREKLVKTVMDLTENVNRISGEVNTKQDTLVSGESIKTVNGESLLGSGGLAISGETLVVDETPTSGSDNLVKSGGVKEELALGSVYDVSAHNSGTTFASLSALLSSQSLSSLIPTAVRKGGMSIKFVLTSDNKYMQYRYMSSSTATADFTNVENWQGVDDKPTAGSQNLVTSGGVKGEIEDILHGESHTLIGTIEQGYISAGGRSSTSYVKVYDVTNKSGIVHVSSQSTGEYALLWVLTANAVAIGDNIINALARSEQTAYYQKEDDIDLSEYPTAKYLYVANNSENDISSASIREGGIVEDVEKNTEDIAELSSSVANKVDKETGKGLSSNDFTNEDKAKLLTLEDDVSSLNDTVFGVEETVETQVEPVSVVGMAYILKNMPRTYLTKPLATNIRNVNFYPVTPGKHYTIYIPKTGNEYGYCWGYANNFPPSGELQDAWDSGAANSIVDQTVGDEQSKSFDISSAGNFSYIAVNYTVSGGSPVFKCIETVVEKGLEQKVEEIEEFIGDISEIEEAVEENSSKLSGLENVEVCLPDTVHAVVGDTLQLFYNAFIKSSLKSDNLSIEVLCDIGAAYPKCFELTPVSGDIGNHTLTVKIRDNNASVYVEKSVVIKVSSVGSSPSNSINVLCVGASTTVGGEWVSELKRRLTSSGGKPVGDGKTNINFVGRKELTYNGVAVKLEATGGFNYYDYIRETLLHRFNIDTSLTLPNISVGDVYSFEGHNYTIYEKNLTNGYFSCTGPYNPTTTSGQLTKVSGQSGSDSTINFIDVINSGNPFMYNGSIDIEQYAEDYCDGQIDVVYAFLFGNGLVTAYDSDEVIIGRFNNAMMPFIQQIKSAFPNCKFCICTPNLPDMLGGLGKNYGAKQLYQYDSQVYSRLRLVKLLNDYIIDNNLSAYVFIADFCAEFDNVHGYIQTLKPYNTRFGSFMNEIDDASYMTDVSKTYLLTGASGNKEPGVYVYKDSSWERDLGLELKYTELFGVNGLHPIESGYFQLADSAYRLFISMFCN